MFETMFSSNSAFLFLSCAATLVNQWFVKYATVLLYLVGPTNVLELKHVRIVCCSRLSISTRPKRVSFPKVQSEGGCSLGTQLASVRQEGAMDGRSVNGCYHATTVCKF